MSFGSSGGGSVPMAVNYGPSPGGYLQAGSIQNIASGMAAQAAEQQSAKALQSLQNQYTAANLGYQPYSNSGVAALDQMNWLLGNPQYTPTAPVAPTAPTPFDQSQQYNSLVSMAHSLNGQEGNLGTWLPDQTSHDVTSIATQLMGRGTLTPGEQGFLNAYMQAGGFAGQPGPDFIKAADDAAQKQYQSDLNAYAPLKANYDFATQVADQYQAKGPISADQLNTIITGLPGYQATQNQGISAIQNASSAKGMLNSGNTLQALENFGQTNAQQYFQNYIGDLANQAGLGAQAANASGTAYQNLGNQQAAIHTNLGDTIANSILASGQALANGVLGGSLGYSSYGSMPIGGGAGGLLGLGGQGQQLGSMAGGAMTGGPWGAAIGGLLGGLL